MSLTLLDGQPIRVARRRIVAMAAELAQYAEKPTAKRGKVGLTQVQSP